MKKIFLFLLLISCSLFPQNNFVKQITSGDFDARNPFIFNNGYGINDNPIFFELHKSGISNIYYKIYNENNHQFEDTVALTSNNYLNINPSYHPSLGLLFQTNQNGNWDIAFIYFNNGNWGETKFLTTSQTDEINPEYFKIEEDHYSVNVDSANILFSRDGSIIHLNYKNDQITEEVVFHSDNNFSYNKFTGLQNYFNGYFTFAIEEDVTGVKRIVRKLKPFGGSYGEKEILKDSCDCDDLDLIYPDFNQWLLIYTDTLQGERRYFALDNPQAFIPPLLNIDIPHDGDLSSMGVYSLFIVSRNENVLMFEPYWAYTYLLKKNGISNVRFNLSDLSIWGDSLYPLKVLNSSLAIGALGNEFDQILVYNVWEDSADGHIQLFGVPTHILFGDVKDESVTNDFVLYQNYPNPFNPFTNIEYRLLEASEIRFNVFNVLGEKVFEEKFGYQTAGDYKINFDGKNLPSGVYIYSIYTEKNRLSRKMLLMK
ncbi:MAG: T9SS type A sorting domain-containing protein [Ignavibacteriaceae bacterium]|jgi:hypothetical protein|nr:T9SS type A sorting domain-containing protein [Ignavibacteriaceae bacterium]